MGRCWLRLKGIPKPNEICSYDRQEEMSIYGIEPQSKADMLYSTIYLQQGVMMSLNTLFTETADHPIVIRMSKWKVLFIGLVSLVFVLGGLWMMSSSQSANVYYETEN